jgi:hypothetical protein
MIFKRLVAVLLGLCLPLSSVSGCGFLVSGLAASTLTRNVLFTVQAMAEPAEFSGPGETHAAIQGAQQASAVKRTTRGPYQKKPPKFRATALYEETSDAALELLRFDANLDDRKGFKNFHGVPGMLRLVKCLRVVTRGSPLHNIDVGDITLDYFSYNFDAPGRSRVALVLSLQLLTKNGLRWSRMPRTYNLLETAATELVKDYHGNLASSGQLSGESRFMVYLKNELRMSQTDAQTICQLLTENPKRFEILDILTTETLPADFADFLTRNRAAPAPIQSTAKGTLSGQRRGRYKNRPVSQPLAMPWLLAAPLLNLGLLFGTLPIRLIIVLSALGETVLLGTLGVSWQNAELSSWALRGYFAWIHDQETLTFLHRAIPIALLGLRSWVMNEAIFPYLHLGPVPFWQDEFLIWAEDTPDQTMMASATSRNAHDNQNRASRILRSAYFLIAASTYWAPAWGKYGIPLLAEWGLHVLTNFVRRGTGAPLLMPSILRRIGQHREKDHERPVRVATLLRKFPHLSWSPSREEIRGILLKATQRGVMAINESEVGRRMKIPRTRSYAGQELTAMEVRLHRVETIVSRPTYDPENRLTWPIERHQFPLAMETKLVRLGVETLDDLLRNWSVNELMEKGNKVGRKSVLLAMAKIKEFNLGFGLAGNREERMVLNRIRGAV